MILDEALLVTMAEAAAPPDMKKLKSPVGGTYQLQCNSDLSSSNWDNLNSPVTATGATLSTTDSLTNGPERFYRLLLAQ